MNRFIFSDPKLCAGCDACVDACSEAHKAAGLQPQARMFIIRDGDEATPVTCRHCENAPCVGICPVNAITLTANAVALDENACIGCKLCAIACPFGVIAFSNAGFKGNADTAIPGAPQGEVAIKCDLCDFSKDGPECVKACSTKALFLVDGKTLRKTANAKRKAAASSMPMVFSSLEERR